MSEITQIGCLSLRLALFAIGIIVALLVTIMVFPILLLVFLMIPFLFL